MDTYEVELEHAHEAIGLRVGQPARGRIAIRPVAAGIMRRGVRSHDALNHAAWTLGRWIAAGTLEQTDVEDALYAAAEHNGLVADDGERQCWATIRSGISAGPLQPVISL